MNYYCRHLGDLARDTAHLTALEFGVYSLLMDWYYANERPIPDALAHRYGRTDPETARSILTEFFTESTDGWRHKRIDAEIAKYNAKAEKNREVGKLGGRPKPSANHDGSQMVSGRLANQTIVGAETNPSHYPLTSSKEREAASASDDAPPTPKREATGTRLPADWQPEDALKAWAVNERKDLNIEREIASFVDYWIGKAGRDGRKSNWPAAFRNWIRNSRNGAPRQSFAAQQGGSRVAGRLL